MGAIKEFIIFFYGLVGPLYFGVAVFYILFLIFYFIFRIVVPNVKKKG